MQINKGNINLSEEIACNNTSFLVEGDIVLPDNLPDISEIFCADANVKITSTEYKNKKAQIFGVVEFHALFSPDDEECELKPLHHSFDFSHSMDMAATDDAEIFSKAHTEHIGFTLVNSRKLSAKVMVALSTCACAEKTYEPITELLDETIEKIEKTHNIYVPVSRTFQDIKINDLLTIPDDMPDIKEILKIDAWVKSGDIREMNEKAMVQGEIRLNTLYSSAENGSPISVFHCIPFTEIVEAPGADDDSVVAVSFDIKNIDVGIKGDLNGNTKIISMESTVAACVKVSKTVQENLIDDCYSINDKEKTTKKTMKISEFVTAENTRITSRLTPELPKNTAVKEIISCTATPFLREAKWENGAAEVHGSLVTYLIYRDENDILRCAVTEDELFWEKAISDPCRLDAEICLEDVSSSIMENSVQIVANTSLFVKALKDKEINILTDFEIEKDEETHTRPLMVVYFANAGDTIWEIAKKYRTRPDIIKSANNLESEKIEKGKRLLIPMA